MSVLEKLPYINSVNIIKSIRINVNNIKIRVIKKTLRKNIKRSSLILIIMFRKIVTTINNENISRIILIPSGLYKYNNIEWYTLFIILSVGSPIFEIRTTKKVNNKGKII